MALAACTPGEPSASPTPSPTDTLPPPIASGDRSTSPDGTGEVVSYAEIALPNRATGARVCTIVTRNDTEIPGDVCMYSLAWGDHLLIGTIQAIKLEDWAFEDFEAFLGTFRTSDAP